MLKYCPIKTVVACIQEDAGSLLTITPVKTSQLHEFYEDVTYECITGYNHSTGDLLRTCQSDGQWDGQLPTCVSKYCDEIETCVSKYCDEIGKINIKIKNNTKQYLIFRQFKHYKSFISHKLFKHGIMGHY